MPITPNKDYYHILQVDSAAEQEVIEAAYKRLAIKYHPDKNSSPDAKQRMQELNEAYGILRDPVTRAKYDGERISTKWKSIEQTAAEYRAKAERRKEEQAEAERVRRRQAACDAEFAQWRMEQAQASRREEAEIRRRRKQSNSRSSRLAEWSGLVVIFFVVSGILVIISAIMGIPMEWTFLCVRVMFLLVIVALIVRAGISRK